MRSTINSELEQSVKQARDVESALRTAVSSRQYEIAKRYQDAHAADANTIKELAKQSSQRELLSYKIFPDPNETSVQIFNAFADAYNKAFDSLIKDLPALDVPTDIEIRRQAGSASVNIGGRRRQSAVGKNNDDEKIVKLIYKKRSEEIPVYANPKVFSGYAFWDNWEYLGSAQAVRDCWYCQLAYWIHKDIVDSIASINSGSESVAASPVKRLLGIRFAGSDAVTETESASELPIYVTESNPGLCSVWTGRKDDEQIDIVHFSVAVVVQANKALKFMEELCSQKEHHFSGYKGRRERQKFKHNQITILKSNIDSVDREDSRHQKYYYGSDAIVILNLVCEYIFNRSGYDEIKPEFVKEEIGQAEIEPVPESKSKSRSRSKGRGRSKKSRKD